MIACGAGHGYGDAVVGLTIVVSSPLSLYSQCCSPLSIREVASCILLGASCFAHFDKVASILFSLVEAFVVTLSYRNRDEDAAIPILFADVRCIFEMQPFP